MCQAAPVYILLMSITGGRSPSAGICLCRCQPVLRVRDAIADNARRHTLHQDVGARRKPDTTDEPVPTSEYDPRAFGGSRTSHASVAAVSVHVKICSRRHADLTAAPRAPPDHP